MSSATSPATLAGETNGRRAARFGSEFGSRVAWGAPGTMWWQCRLLRKCEEELGTTTCSPQKVLAIAFKLGKTRRGVTFYVPFGPGFLSQVRQPSLQPDRQQLRGLRVGVPPGAWRGGSAELVPARPPVLSGSCWRRGIRGSPLQHG